MDIVGKNPSVGDIIEIPGFPFWCKVVEIYQDGILPAVRPSALNTIAGANCRRGEYYILKDHYLVRLIEKGA